MMGAGSDRTAALGTMIANSKLLSAKFLARIGLPAAEHRLVRTAEAAAAAAQAIGYPLVVKPESGSNGRGVAVGVADRQALDNAYQAARAVNPGVLIERFIPGRDHRMLVVGGRLVATVRRDAAHVVGDGELSVAALMERVNSDPRRARGVLAPLKALRLDEATRAVLQAAGMTPQSVPAKGQHVPLARTANLSRGASATDVSDQVHPDNRWMAETVAAMCNLDIVGIDFITPDITRPFSEVPCGINEINIRPGLGPHYVSENRGHEIASLVFDAIAGDGDPGTIPLVAVLAAAGAEGTVAATAQVLSQAGLHTVSVCGSGIRSGNQQLCGTPLPGGRAAAEAILANPDAEAGVMATSPAAIHDHGLGWTRSDVVLVRAPLDGDSDAAALDVLLATLSEALVIEAACIPVLAPCRPLNPNKLVVICDNAHEAEQHVAQGRRSIVPDGEHAVMLPARTRWPLPEGESGAALASAAVPLALGLTEERTAP